MAKIILSNASLKEVFSWRNIKISKVVYQKGYMDVKSFPNYRRIGIIFSRIFSDKHVTMEWTNPTGKHKTKSFKLLAGYIISW